MNYAEAQLKIKTVKIKITFYDTQPLLVSSIAPSSLESLPCRIALIWSFLQQQDPQLMNQTQIVKQLRNEEHVCTQFYFR